VLAKSLNEAHGKENKIKQFIFRFESLLITILKRSHFQREDTNHMIIHLFVNLKLTILILVMLKA